MAPPATTASRTSTRSPRPGNRWTGRALVAGSLFALTPLIVRGVRTWVEVGRLTAEREHEVRRRVPVTSPASDRVRGPGGTAGGGTGGTTAVAPGRGHGSAGGHDVPAAVLSSLAQQTELLALDAAIDARVTRTTTGSAVAAGRVAVPSTTAGTGRGGATGWTAARGGAHGPTTALWHAVQTTRPVGPVDGACEVTVCGSLVRLGTGQGWPVAARNVCPTCATLAR
jgi:hypothetical protein